MLNNADVNTFDNNNVFSFNDSPWGISVADSYSGTYTCNTIHGFNYGIHFNGVCDESNLVGNTFSLSNSKDLVVGHPESLNTFSDMTVIGDQGNWDDLIGWGNQWNTANSKVHHSGTEEIIQGSEFLVYEDPQNPVGYMPQIIEAAGQWFSNDAVRNLDCGGGHIVPDDNECDTLIDKILSLDTLREMDDCVKTLWQYKYFKQLLILEETDQLSTDCEQYLIDQEDHAALQLARIGRAVESLDTLKTSIGYVIERSDEGDVRNDILTQRLDSIRTVIMNTEVLDSCLKVLNRVNVIRLNQIESDTFSNGDLSILLPIAYSCPNEMGEGVYWARGLLSMYADLKFPDFLDCTRTELNPRSSTREKTALDKLQLFPNPASSEVHVYLKLSEKETGKILILDFNGDEKYMDRVDEYKNSFTIDTGSYPNGIYIVKYVSSEGKEKIEKLIITK